MLNKFVLIFPNPSAECTYAATSFVKEARMYTFNIYVPERGEGSMHYCVAYNSSVERAWIQNCPLVEIELRWTFRGLIH